MSGTESSRWVGRAAVAIAAVALVLPLSAGNATAVGTAVVSPTSVSFGTAVIGASSTRTVTFSADGVQVYSVDITGAGPFAITSDDCTGQNIVAPRTCSVDVTFAPTTRGPFSASLVFTDEASPSTQSVPLSGTGVAPIVGVIPASHDFGSTAIGSSVGPWVFTVSNDTTDTGQTLSVTSVTMTSADFAFVTNGCTFASLNPGASCTFSVSFRPTVMGTRNAVVSVSTNDPVTPTKQATVTGFGTPSADVSVAASGPSSTSARNYVTYLFTVGNAGPSVARNVTVAVPVPSSSRYYAVTASTGSCTAPASGASSGTVTCTIGDLDTSTRVTIAVTFKLSRPKAGSVTVVANAASTASGSGAATPDPNTANNIASVTTTVTK